ncbi:hypothetical protein F7725_005408 [Dissostichus mawsoni]|uniref:Kazal-like domain-containing protein n=1 Tax=Dissostichus mawsoni TaxID=36200 RepID=A0A7J5YSC0_DISMA|nr:hypothetical protein F7725_005408 [Dissostichus mawsoni]
MLSIPLLTDIVAEEANEPQILPTLVTFEASSKEQDDEELSSQDNANANASKQEEEFEVTEKSDKHTAVLLSEEELVDLLKKEAEEEQEAEERMLEEDEDEMDKGKEESDETVETIEEDEGQEEDDKLEMEEKDVNKEIVGDAEMLEKEEKEVEKSGEIVTGGKTLLEETDGSTESEIPVDLDYAADSGILPLQILSAQIKPHTHDIQPPSKEDIKRRKPVTKHCPPLQMKKMSKTLRQWTLKNQRAIQSLNQGPDWQERKRRKARMTVEATPRERQGSRRRTSVRGSTLHRVRKHSLDRNRANKILSRPSSRNESSADKSDSGSLPRIQALPDPCDNFPCKRGKTCKLDADKKPGCVCQEPADCPHSANEFDNVCGTNNKTYDTSCELFATKCNLEGTKRGHRLHMDYTGPCKLIPQCVDTELVQFPLRMRDWLKNVLLQLFEHDSMSPGFLTPKQRFRVKKIFESERRLRAGDHSVELLAQDFEKNYNMYIYPVHWQFAQLDQHPSDRILSHSELAPLRVPLVPMEHCTSRFFQECDADKDKQVSFKEWTSCFGIKNDDMDVNLLF